MRHGAGVFRRLLHELDDDAPFTFDGIPLWLAECGAVCVPLEQSPDGRPPCDTCFQQPEGGPE
jgi:hypothetical protein